jgi:hypothetical protein
MMDKDFLHRKYSEQLNLLNSQLLNEIDFSIKFPCEDAFIKVKETRRCIYEVKQELRKLGNINAQ